MNAEITYDSALNVIVSILVLNTVGSPCGWPLNSWVYLGTDRKYFRARTVPALESHRILAVFTLKKCYTGTMYREL